MPRSSRTKAALSERSPRHKPSHYLTIGQRARILGLSASTLRLWESAGLVRPARTEGKYRLYSKKTLERLKRIQYLRTTKHLNIAGIRHILGEDEKEETDETPGVEPRLGSRLRDLRIRRGFTLSEAASSAGSEDSYSHDGEEFLYVIEGRLEIRLDEVDRYVLEPGDTLSFQSSHGHRWVNPSPSEEAVLIWVNTTPPAE